MRKIITRKPLILISFKLPIYFKNLQHPTPQKYNEKFRHALAQLNPEQLAAVNKMDGPDLNKGIGKTVKSVK